MKEQILEAEVGRRWVETSCTPGQGHECGWSGDSALLPHPPGIGGLVDPGEQDPRGAEGGDGLTPRVL